MEEPSNIYYPQAPKHTAGPWHRNIKPAWKYPIVFSGRNTHVAQIISSGLSLEEVEANCNLVVAAPQLLSAVKEFLINKYCSCGGFTCARCQVTVDEACAAVKKAEGVWRSP